MRMARDHGTWSGAACDDALCGQERTNHNTARDSDPDRNPCGLLCFRFAKRRGMTATEPTRKIPARPILSLRSPSEEGPRSGEMER